MNPVNQNPRSREIIYDVDNPPTPVFNILGREIRIFDPSKFADEMAFPRILIQLSE